MEYIRREEQLIKYVCSLQVQYTVQLALLWQAKNSLFREWTINNGVPVLTENSRKRNLSNKANTYAVLHCAEALCWCNTENCEYLRPMQKKRSTSNAHFICTCAELERALRQPDISYESSDTCNLHFDGIDLGGFRHSHTSCQHSQASFNAAFDQL